MNRVRILAISGVCASIVAVAACKPEAATEAPSVDAPPAATPSHAAVWPDEEFRATQPPAGEVTQTKIPAVETFELDNGLTVYLVKEDRLPVFSMSIQFDVGAAGDPIKKAGMTDLCLDVMDEGTKGMDKPAFEAKQDEHALSVYMSGGSETSTANVSGLVSELDAGMALLSEMLREPGFRQSDFDRLASKQKARVEQARASAGRAGSRVFGRFVWGEGNPMGAITTEATLDAVKLADCKKVASRLGPEGARLFVYGRVDEQSVRDAFGKHFSDWKGKQKPDRRPAPPKPKTGAIYVVDVPDSAQSQIIVGYPGPRRDAADYTATNAMTGVFGGGFTSRLNMNLREDKGFAYGARGGFSYNRDGSIMRAASSVETTTTGAALVEIERELSGMVTNPPTTDELQREKDSALLAMPARYASASDALGRFRSLVYYGLPVNWDENYQGEVEALTLDAVNAAAKKHLRTKDVTIVIAGDKKTIGPQLEKLAADGDGILGAKRVIYVDADGNPN